MALVSYQLIQQELIASDISIIYLKPQTEKIHFQAGQYIFVVHQDQSYSPLSIACAPDDSGQIALHLWHPASNLPAQDILRLLKNNRQLNLMGAMGDCCFGKIKTTLPILFLVRGTGFAPVKALVEAWKNAGNMPAIHLFWYGENYLASLPQEWGIALANFQYTVVADKNIMASVIKNYPHLTGYQVYVVDSATRVKEILQRCLELGLLKENFFSDV